MIEHNELLEHAQYVGNYYGTPKAYVQQQLQAHKHVILEIEIQGALKISSFMIVPFPEPENPDITINNPESAMIQSPLY